MRGWFTKTLCLVWISKITVAFVIPGSSQWSIAGQLPQRQRKQQQSSPKNPFSLISLSTAMNDMDQTINTQPSSKHPKIQAAKNMVQAVWKRMDTLEAAGFKNESSMDYPPLVSRGGGFKRFLILMAVGMAYKWYRARFINKIPFWEKQPQWNMVVTTKEQEDALRAYTCRNCGATLFIARNREWFFEGGTGLAGLGCYSCGAKGKDNFVMDRNRIVDEVGDEDDYFAYERPLDFVTAAERKELLQKTRGDEEAANQILLDHQKSKTSTGQAPPPMFGVMPEDIVETKDNSAESSVELEAVEAVDDQGNQPDEPPLPGTAPGAVSPSDGLDF